MTARFGMWFVTKMLVVLAMGCGHRVVLAATILCNNVNDIKDAMVQVKAGDEIVLAPGIYHADGLAISGTSAHFASYVDGTHSAPIVMKSQNPNDPATLVGTNVGSLTCLRIFGAHWTILDIKVTNAQKGIVFDNAPHGKVINCTVYGIGYEAIHWRDGSDFGLIESCRIFDTGLTKPGFGEAIYIGTDKGSWGKYDRDVTYVTIRNCIIGPGIAAEAFDIKEGTEEIVVEYNTVDATGISNVNYADSFIDLKGTRTYVRYNTFLQNGETKLTKGIAVIDRGVVLSSYEHAIHDNSFYLDSSNIKMVEAYSGTSHVYAWNNARYPEGGELYSSSVHNECCPQWYSPPEDGTCYTPLQFTVDQITNTSARFSWVGGASMLSGNLEYYIYGQTTPTIEQVTGITGSEFTVFGLESDTVYAARIQAVCESSNSIFTNDITFRSLDNNDPGPNNDFPDRPEGAIAIYGDVLASGWFDASYGGSYELSYSADSREGSQCIQATFGDYGGLQLKNNNGVDGSAFSFLHFWIKDDSSFGSGSSDIRLKLDSMQQDFQIEAMGWNQMLIPISEGSITKIVLQNRSPNSRTVYIDSIELWPEITTSGDSMVPSFTPSQAPSLSSRPSRSPLFLSSELPSHVPSEMPSDSPSLRPSISTTNPVAGSSFVYDEGLNVGWNDYSFKGTYDFENTDSPRQGKSMCLRAEMNGWGGLHVKHGVTDLDVSSFGWLRLYARHDDTGATIALRLKVNSQQHDFNLPATGKWIEFEINLNNFGSPTTISTLTLQNRSSSSRVIYLDGIQFHA